MQRDITMNDLQPRNGFALLHPKAVSLGANYVKLTEAKYLRQKM